MKIEKMEDPCKYTSPLFLAVEMPAGPQARVERTLPGPKDRLLLPLPQIGAHSVAWTMGTATWGL